jgi:hypothetical protein
VTGSLGLGVVLFDAPTPVGLVVFVQGFSGVLLLRASGVPTVKSVEFVSVSAQPPPERFALVLFDVAATGDDS